MLNNPDWFYWAYEQEQFKGQIFGEAELVYNYAKTIRPLKNKLFTYISDTEGKITVSLVEAKGSSQKDYPKYLDLEYPRKLKGYNREEDYEAFMNSVQKLLFGKISHIHQARCM